MFEHKCESVGNKTIKAKYLLYKNRCFASEIYRIRLSESRDRSKRGEKVINFKYFMHILIEVLFYFNSKFLCEEI